MDCLKNKLLLSGYVFLYGKLVPTLANIFSCYLSVGYVFCVVLLFLSFQPNWCNCTNLVSVLCRQPITVVIVVAQYGRQIWQKKVTLMTR